MRILELTVSGFKCFRESTTVTKFAPGFNVIIGTNGSGKSSLFHAIQLLLTDEFKKLKAQERTALAFGGRLIGDMPFIELVLDNRDGSLPIEGSRVTLRRYITTGKDKLLVNGKDVNSVPGLQGTKGFTGLLDVAGFVNPYFFVKQGTVTEMALATGSARLSIVQDVSGIRLWEAKRASITARLESTRRSVEETEGLIAEINAKHEEFKKELEEFKKYENLQKMKRAFEFNLYDRELSSAKGQRAVLIQEKEELVAQLNETETEVIREKAKVEAAVGNLEKAKGELSIIDISINSDSDALLDLNQRMTQLYNQIKDAEQSLKVEAELGQDSKAKTKTLQSQITKLEKTLERVNQNLEDRTTEEEELKTRSADLRKRFRITNLKFETKALASESLQDCRERINAQIDQVNSDITKKEELIANEEKELSDKTTKLQELSAQLQDTRGIVESDKKKISDLLTQLNQLLRELVEVKEGRRRDWLRTCDLEQQIMSLSEARNHEINLIKRKAGGSTGAGWDGVLRVIADFERKGRMDIVNGYHGLLIENFKTQEEFQSAAEAGGGKVLFYHVVSNRSVSTAILKEFNRLKFRGDVSFIPMDTLVRRNHPRLPQGLRGATLLKDNLEFPQVLEPAFHFAFGSTLVCESIELAAKYAREYKMKCVTMDGDKISPSGPITGGYLDQSLSSIGAQARKMRLDLELEKLKEEKQNLATHCEELKTREDQLSKEIAQKELRLERSNLQQEKYTMQVNNVLEKVRNAHLDIEARSLRLKGWRDELAELQETSEILTNELNSDDMSCTPDNKRAYQKMAKEFRTTQKLLHSIFQKIQELQKEKRDLNSRLTIARAKLEELKMDPAVPVNLNSKTDLQKQELEEIQAKVTAVQENLTEAETSRDAKLLETKELQQVVDDLKNAKGRVQEKLNNIRKELGNFDIKEHGLRTKIEEFTGPLKDIGSYPTLAEKYGRVSSSSLYKRLKDIQEKLIRLGPVNCKAVQMNEEVEAKKAQFAKNLQVFRQSHDRVVDLLDHVNQKGFEVFLKTCRNLQVAFREIFLELVPGGAAELRFQTLRGFELIEGQPCPDFSRRDEPDEFVSVSLLVNFRSNNRHSRRMEMSALSGGEKSVVALSFLFALQKCDPVSLYLFDEVDQALDPRYRESVAKFIKKLSGKSQFICTTFRKEFIDHADAFFGVKKGGLSSSVQKITREVSSQFVQPDSGEPSSFEDSNEDHGSYDPSSSRVEA